MNVIVLNVSLYIILNILHKPLFRELSFQSAFDEASLLGAPLLEGQELDCTLTKCCSELSNAIDKLETLSSHDALILLRSSVSAPKIQHILRNCGIHAALAMFDALLRTGISRILNLNLSDVQWLQASLPVRDSGLGTRRIASLAIPARMASAASTRRFLNIILSASSAGEDPYLTEFQTCWTISSGLSLPGPRSSLKQRSWDEPGLQNDKTTLWNSASADFQKARLAAVSPCHSGDWLHARPISSCGLRLEDEANRLQLGYATPSWCRSPPSSQMSVRRYSWF